MARAKGTRLAQQAQLQAKVKFGPQLDVLTDLMQKAADDRQAAIETARAGARGTIDAVNAARPEVKQIYDRAGLSAVNRATTLLGKDLSGLGQVADSIKAAGTTEQAGAASRLAQAKAAALQDLTDRRIGATAGVQYARMAADRQFKSDARQILQQRQQLLGQAGDFTASTLNDLLQQAQDRRTKLTIENLGNAQSERNSMRSSGIDPDTGRAIPGGPADPARNKPKPKWVTPTQQGAVQDSINEALAAVKLMQSVGLTRADMGQALLAGRPDKGIPKVRPLIASVALDVALDGHISRRNVHELRKRRVRPGKLGFKLPSQTVASAPTNSVNGKGPQGLPG